MSVSAVSHLPQNIRILIGSLHAGGKQRRLIVPGCLEGFKVMREDLNRRQQQQSDLSYVGSEAVALVRPQPTSFFGSEALWECKLSELDIEPQQQQEPGRRQKHQLQKGSWRADVDEIEGYVPSNFVLLLDEGAEDFAPSGMVELSSTEVPGVLVVQVLNGHG
jgi:hypothetical protein